MHIKVHAYADAGAEALIHKEEDLFEVFVREAPQKGQANKRIIELVHSYFIENSGKKNIEVKLVSGARSPHKIFHIKT